jgi:uncharacterized protein with FMN-binding domain
MDLAMNATQKRLLRNAAIMVVLTLAMGIGLTLYIRGTGTVPSNPPEAASYLDGTYTATETGLLSDVTVTVTITGGQLTAIEADASGETPALGGAAAESLTAAILAAGTTDGVDSVSGATYTSTAVLTAAAECLAQAKG